MNRQVDLRVPDVGDADTIELIEWHVKPGESFDAGAELCDLVTDKAAFSLEAEQGGVLDEIIVNGRRKVRAGEVVARASVA